MHPKIITIDQLLEQTMANFHLSFLLLNYIYVQYSHRLSGGEDGVRWCQMVSCLSDACSVVSDGVEWFQLLSGGEDGIRHQMPVLDITPQLWETTDPFLKSLPCNSFKKEYKHFLLDNQE